MLGRIIRIDAIREMAYNPRIMCSVFLYMSERISKRVQNSLILWV